MNRQNPPIQSQYNAMFFVHLFVTVLSWVGPFLFDWWLMCFAYLIVLAQFAIFDRCLMNAGHSIEEDQDFTFYAFLLEKLSFRIPRKPLKQFVRSYLYVFLATFSFILQKVLLYHPPYGYTYWSHYLYAGL